MSSGLSSGIISYSGSVPSWDSGLIAALPAAGLVAGDLYLSTDTMEVYQWTGSEWVVVLSSTSASAITGTAAAGVYCIGIGPSSIGPGQLIFDGTSNIQTAPLIVKNDLTAGYNIQPAVHPSYLLSSTDYTVICDTTGGGIQIQPNITGMPPGQIFVIKITAGINAVTFKPQTGGTIDGASSYSFASTGANKPIITIQYAGEDWYIINHTIT